MQRTYYQKLRTSFTQNTGLTTSSQVTFTTHLDCYTRPLLITTLPKTTTIKPQKYVLNGWGVNIPKFQRFDIIQPSYTQSQVIVKTPKSFLMRISKRWSKQATLRIIKSYNLNIDCQIKILRYILTPIGFGKSLTTIINTYKWKKSTAKSYSVSMMLYEQRNFMVEKHFKSTNEKSQILFKKFFSIESLKTEH